MKQKFFFILFTLFSISTLSFASPTLYVAPLDGDMSQIQGWQPALGEGLAEMLITEITKLNKFEVLESTALPELMDEIKLGEAGYVDQDEKVNKGSYAGADYMFRGKVTRFGSKQQNMDLGGFVPFSGGALGIKSSTSDVRIDWRIVDTATRKIITSGKAVGTESGMGFDIGVSVDGHGGNIGFGNQEFMNSALGKATVKAINEIMTQVASASLPSQSGREQVKAQKQQAQQTAMRSTTGKVLAVPSPDMLIVSLGSQHGFKEGDKLKIYQTENILDDQGNVVFTDEKFAGEVILQNVQADRSKASYSGTAPATAGWTVKCE